MRIGVQRDSLGGIAQVLAGMIKIDQVAALLAKLLFHLACDPRCALPHRANSPRSRLASRTRKAVGRPFRRRLQSCRHRPASGSLWRAPGKSWPLSTRVSAFTLVLLAGVLRLDDGNHAA